MNQKTPVARLNEIMTKLGIFPEYELVQGGHGENLFMMKVSCPMSPDGDVLSACGSFGGTKQQAKHNAAMAFLQSFCKDENANAYERIVNINTGITHKGCEMLSDICSKNHLEQPDYIDLYIGGSKQDPIWIVECKVSYISTEGQGRKKSEAREDAAIRMYSILTTKGPVLEILCSANFAEPTTSPKIVPSRKTPQEYQNLSLSSNFTHNHNQTETPRAHRKPDIAREMLRMVNERKVAQKMRNNNDDTESNESLADM